MARPLRIEYEGAFYHVTSRGNERKRIFHGSKVFKPFVCEVEGVKERSGSALDP
jgi:hypothetical protein